MAKYCRGAMVLLHRKCKKFRQKIAKKRRRTKRKSRFRNQEPGDNAHLSSYYQSITSTYPLRGACVKFIDKPPAIRSANDLPASGAMAEPRPGSTLAAPHTKDGRPPTTAPACARNPPATRRPLQLRECRAGGRRGNIEQRGYPASLQDRWLSGRHVALRLAMARRTRASWGMRRTRMFS